MAFNQKVALGFQKGYVTIFKGINDNNEAFFQQSNARFTTAWGWYIVSTESVPNPLPEGVSAIQLPWDLVKSPTDENSLRPQEEINPILNSLLFPPSPSTHQGSIGERLTLDVIVTKNKTFESSYGKKTIHVFEDKSQNVYVWTTSAKDWPVGSSHHIRATVKEHNLYQNTKQTILTRCIEVK